MNFTTQNAGAKRAFTVGEAAHLYNISRSRLYLLNKAGTITFRKLGAKTLILAEDLDRFVASRPSLRETAA